MSKIQSQSLSIDVVNAGDDGTMLLTCIMANEEAQTNNDGGIRYFCINFSWNFAC